MEGRLIFDQDCIKIDQTYLHHDLCKSLLPSEYLKSHKTNENLSELICGIRFLTTVEEAKINKVIMIINTDDEFLIYVRVLVNMFPRIGFHLYAQRSINKKFRNLFYEGPWFDIHSWRGFRNCGFIYHSDKQFPGVVNWIRYLNPALWLIDFILPYDKQYVEFLDGDLLFIPYSENYTLKVTCRNKFCFPKIITYDTKFLTEIIHYQNTEIINKIDLFANVFTKTNISYSSNSLIFNRDYNSSYFLFVILRYIRLLNSSKRPKGEDQILDFALKLIFDLTSQN